jgi:serine/threonine-protein kinase
MTRSTTRSHELVGSTVAGFELVRHVAHHDGVASVYEAVRGNERAAVKLYHSSWLARAQRNEREELAQRQIAHPCVARVLAADRLADGSFVLASEWIDGESLEARLAKGPLPWASIVAIVRDIARGLGAIHTAKVVHRDVKPSNILLPASGAATAVMVDFGHALVVDEARLTASGVVLGSAHYMAPEQAQGLAIDHRVDLYAAGVVLYRMLTGVVPFDHASPAEVMRMHQQEPVPPPRTRTNNSVPRAAEDLCLWLLAKSPAQRVPNAHVLRLTVEALEKAPVRTRDLAGKEESL